MYVYDGGNRRIQSFPLTTLAGSPNGTTILGESLLDNDRNRPISISGMAFDRMRHLLYLCNYVDQRLLILNTTENTIQIIDDTELSIVNSSIRMRPHAIVIDETSNSFYVSDSSLNIVISKVQNWFNSRHHSCRRDNKQFTFQSTRFTRKFDARFIRIFIHCGYSL